METGKNAKKSSKTVIIVVLAVLVVLVLAFLFITGKLPPKGRTTGAGTGTSTSEKSYAAAQEDKKALEDCVLAALDEETAKTVSEVTVFEHNGEYSVRVRAVVAGGLHFPAIIEQTAQPFFDKAAELGLTAKEYTVEEYSKNNAGDVDGLISWKSKDGKTGTYTDGTGEKPYIKANATVDDIRDIVK